ncbi:MAG: DEAD/DEAH box helicase [Ilumatobacteraceae bacterium]
MSCVLPVMNAARRTSPDPTGIGPTDIASSDFLVTAAERVGAAYPDLFVHQRSGVAFLLSRRRAVLADDMGLGKTRTAIVAAREQSPDGPYLVICPAGLKLNWEREIRMVEPGASVQVLSTEPLDASARWVVVNYDRLNRHVDDLAAVGFPVVIIDEAHAIKNDSARTKRTLRLVSPGGPDAVYLLTGTPITNRPRDLFNLLKAIDHPLGKSFYRYAKRYCNAVDNGYGLDTNGASNLDELSSVVAGVMLRRAKSEVLDLPEKVRTWLPIDLPTGRVGSLEQRALDYLADNPARSGPTWGTFLGMLNKSRHALAVAKATPTADFVGDLVEAGQKVVVFTGYTAVVDTLRDRFGDAAVVVTGEIASDARQVAVDRFQADPNIRVFIGNLAAAGVGITLTAGDHVVFNDLDWVPANHWQAEDRIHRIGRRSTSFVTYLYTPGTLDGFVAGLLEQKAAMVARVEADAAAQSTLIDAVVRLASEAEPGSAATTEPQRPTMGLLSETLALLEQFRADSASAVDASTQSGVRVFTFPSSRDPKVVYTTELVNGVATCDCPGFSYGGNCKHAREALRS